MRPDDLVKRVCADSIILLEQTICLQRLFAGLPTDKTGLGIKISGKKMCCPLQVIFRLREPVAISRLFSTILIFGVALQI